MLLVELKSFISFCRFLLNLFIFVGLPNFSDSTINSTTTLAKAILTLLELIFWHFLLFLKHFDVNRRKQELSRAAKVQQYRRLKFNKNVIRNKGCDALVQWQLLSSKKKLNRNSWKNIIICFIVSLCLWVAWIIHYFRGFVELSRTQIGLQLISRESFFWSFKGVFRQFFRLFW